MEMIRINGAGNTSTLLNYSTIDDNPYFGISYYRLKQTDFDGQYSYSQIRSVNIRNEGDSKIEIFPNHHLYLPTYLNYSCIYKNHRHYPHKLYDL